MPVLQTIWRCQVCGALHEEHRDAVACEQEQADGSVENRRKLDTASDAVEAALSIFECTTPAGGLGPGTHCAACCYGTGYVVTCPEEDELVRALSDARRALARYTAPQGVRA